MSGKSSKNSTYFDIWTCGRPGPLGGHCGALRLFRWLGGMVARAGTHGRRPALASVCPSAPICLTHHDLCLKNSMLAPHLGGGGWVTGDRGCENMKNRKSEFRKYKGRAETYLACANVEFWHTDTDIETQPKWMD